MAGAKFFNRVEDANACDLKYGSQNCRTEATGMPYVEEDRFYIFDGFDFGEGHSVFDNRFAQKNLRLFVANDAVSLPRQLAPNVLSEYLLRQERGYGVPIFVDHPEKMLTDSQKLEVIMSYLMIDFDCLNRRYVMEEICDVSLKNAQTLWEKISENKVNNISLASVFDSAREKTNQYLLIRLVA